MPRFMCYCPDVPNILEHRLSVRPRHTPLPAIEQKNGTMVYWGGIAPRPGMPAYEVKDGSPNMVGSLMVFKMDTIEQVWERLKGDVYWTEGVWDKDRIIVEQLLDF